MKKLTSTLSLILIVVLAILSYFSDLFPSHSEKMPNKANQASPYSTQQTKPNMLKSAVTKGKISANYDYIMQNDKIGPNQNATVDYYMLALSWSPAFCQQQREKYDNVLPHSLQYQCGEGQSFGWVVHGLWAQNKNARQIADHPRFCRGDLPMLPVELIEQYLSISPGAELLQGEWEKHGACAFNSAQDYFAKEAELFHSLQLPNEYLDRKSLFRWLKQHNPALKDRYLAANQGELFICYDLQWNLINCPN